MSGKSSQRRKQVRVKEADSLASARVSEDKPPTITKSQEQPHARVVSEVPANEYPVKRNPKEPADPKDGKTKPGRISQWDFVRRWPTLVILISAAVAEGCALIVGILLELDSYSLLAPFFTLIAILALWTPSRTSTE
jgi:hypothetical protein